MASSFHFVNNPSSSEVNPKPSSSNLEESQVFEDCSKLMAELERIRSLEQEHRARIHHLEQALDQALACLGDLKQKLQTQDLLETHLARTEDFSHVQQQVIHRLKQQLSQQQQIIDAQRLEITGRDQALKELTEIVEAQQRELKHLRAHDVQDEELQTYHRYLVDQIQVLQVDLETRQSQVLMLEAEVESGRTQMTNMEEQLHEAQQQILELSGRLNRHQLSLSELELQLETAHLTLNDQQNLELALRRIQTIAAERNVTIATFQKDLAITQIRVEELEAQLAKQSRLQAKWQQNCHELEIDRDRHQARASKLEREVAEMQEQIFQQARQSSEYETAIQHWKERYLLSQYQLAHLQELFHRVQLQHPLTEHQTLELTPVLIELFTELEKLQPAETTEPAPLPLVPSSRFNTLDLPDFLMRRRSSYRAKT